MSIKDFMKSRDFLEIVAEEIIDNFDDLAEACPEGLIHGVASYVDIISDGKYQMNDVIVAIEDPENGWPEIVERAIDFAHIKVEMEDARIDAELAELEEEEAEMDAWEAECAAQDAADDAAWMAECEEE